MAATSNPLVGIPITEKLSKTNYAMWEAQILAAIHGARLYRHLTGPTPAPSAEIDGEVDGKSCKVPNPAYHWRMKNLLNISLQVLILISILLSHLWLQDRTLLRLLVI